MPGVPRWAISSVSSRAIRGPEIEVERAYVGHLERTTKNPTIVTLERLAAALRAPISELFVEPPYGQKRPEPLRGGQPDCSSIGCTSQSTAGHLSAQPHTSISSRLSRCRNRCASFNQLSFLKVIPERRGNILPQIVQILFQLLDRSGIRKVCSRFVALCRSIGLLQGGSVAVDGSKFKAVRAACSARRLQRYPRCEEPSHDDHLRDCDSSVRPPGCASTACRHARRFPAVGQRPTETRAGEVLTLGDLSGRLPPAL
jgi:DNA-binding XRE family transcriptional regulator